VHRKLTAKNEAITRTKNVYGGSSKDVALGIPTGACIVLKKLLCNTRYRF